MWYRKSQLLNITNQTTPSAVGLEQSVLLTNDPLINNNDDTTWNGPIPPLHERCRCQIETMLDGHRVWKAQSNACPICKQTRDRFNHQGV